MHVFLHHCSFIAKCLFVDAAPQIPNGHSGSTVEEKNQCGCASDKSEAVSSLAIRGSQFMCGGGRLALPDEVAIEYWLNRIGLQGVAA